jgi:hypothetical protein
VAQFGKENSQSRLIASTMNNIKIIHDTTAHTLTVWTGDSSTESVCEETSDEVVLMKNAQGHVIGIEFLHFNPDKHENGLSVETLVHA